MIPNVSFSKYLVPQSIIDKMKDGSGVGKLWIITTE